jgi:hypothetical protein
MANVPPAIALADPSFIDDDAGASRPIPTPGPAAFLKFGELPIRKRIKILRFLGKQPKQQFNNPTKFEADMYCEVQLPDGTRGMLPMPSTFLERVDYLNRKYPFFAPLSTIVALRYVGIRISRRRHTEYHHYDLCFRHARNNTERWLL